MDINKFGKLTQAMTEPTTSVGGALLMKKIIALFLPVAASLLAFWLGLHFVPIRKGHEREDMVNRVMGCLFSSCILGITTLVLIYHHWPGIFESAGKLAQAASLPHAAGFFAMTASVLIVCAVPGPWIVAGLFLWLEKRKGKDIGEMFHDLKKDIRNDPRNDWYTPNPRDPPFPYQPPIDANYPDENAPNQERHEP